MDGERRKKGKNFTNTEINIFMDLLPNYISVIENKKTDGATQKIKNNAWEALTKDFNASNANETRTSSQLKTFYDNFKRKKRKEFVDDKAEVHETESTLKKKSDSCGEKLISMLQEQFQADDNVFNSAADYHDENVFLFESGIATETISSKIKKEDDPTTSITHSNGIHWSVKDEDANSYRIEKEDLIPITNNVTTHSIPKRKCETDHIHEPEQKKTSVNVYADLEKLAEEKSIKNIHKNECLQLKMQYNKIKLERIIRINEEQHELFLLQKKKLENEVKIQEIQIKREELKLRILENDYKTESEGDLLLETGS